VGRLILRVLMVMGGVVVLAGAVVVVSIAWARSTLVRVKGPLPPIDAVAGIPERQAAPMRLSWINTASQFIPRAALLEPTGDPDAGAWARMAFPVFVLEWADGRILLVDAGMDGPGARAFGAPLERLAGADPIAIGTDVAAALGKARERVAGIVFTHLHDDHVQGIESLCRASARPVEALVAAAQADYPNYLTRGSLEALKAIPCVRVVPLPAAPMQDLPGFPGVSLVAVAGHTPGTQLVVARIGRSERPIVLAGDVTNLHAGLEHDLPKPWLYRLLVVPEDDARLGELRRYLRDLEQRYGMTVLVSHDQAWLEASGVPAYGGAR
jgi:glyoxylase-like metal-dependent hydrolase (beta-lactamase superfamily II)